MSPESGRFLSVDPFLGRFEEPLTLHKYLYVNAQPTLLTDPQGLMGSEYDALTALQIASFLAAIAVATTIGYFVDKVVQTVVTAGLKKLGVEEASTIAQGLIFALGALFPDPGDATKFLGPLTRAGLDKAFGRSFTRAFSRTGGFIRKIPGTGNIVRLEAIQIKGAALAPGPNAVTLSNGIEVNLVLSSDYRVITFHPVSGPGVFEMKDYYLSKGLPF